jgi:predicted NACHT family NTPase
MLPLPMAKPTLRSTPEGLACAQQALTRSGLTQKELCTRIPCSRQPITNFFKGEPVTQALFASICEHLKLDWEAIADLTPSGSISLGNKLPNRLTGQMLTGQMLTGEMLTGPNLAQKRLDQPFEPETSGEDLDGDGDTAIALVQSLRQRIHANLQARCGTMRILEMTHPVDVIEIYIQINVLGTLIAKQGKRLEQLTQNFQAQKYKSLQTESHDNMHPVLEVIERCPKLIILGKPGAGKTTLLKYLAVRCNSGEWRGDRLPIFVTLKDFAEAPNQPRLLEYISQRDLDYYDAALDPEQAAKDKLRRLRIQTEFDQVLQDGRALILLDGLDEVRAEDHDRILAELRGFIEKYRNNPFLMTCRLSAWEYTFEAFTEIEVIDFQQNQINKFAQKWFSDKRMKSEDFLSCLDRHPRVRDLATNPLLLTLLCSAFENSGDLPINRAELYRDGVDALLKKWDSTRGIHRDQIYQELSHQRKKDLLSTIAVQTFQDNQYFFLRSQVESTITAYLKTLDKTSNEDSIQQDSETVLRAIEAQHGLLVERAQGVYSFSHITFHEYFVARQFIFRNVNQDEKLDELMKHLCERRWREIFLLSTEMLSDASCWLQKMHQRIETLVEEDQQIRTFLEIVRTRSIAPEYQFIDPAAARAFHFDNDSEIDPKFRLALRIDPQAVLLVCANFWARILDLEIPAAIAMAQTHRLKILEAKSANQAMLIAIRIAIQSDRLPSPEKPVLTKLLRQVSKTSEKQKIAKVAQEAHYRARQLKAHIFKPWFFSPGQQEILKNYYFANLLLVDCLKSDICLLAESRKALKASILSMNPKGVNA